MTGAVLCPGTSAGLGWRSAVPAISLCCPFRSSASGSDGAQEQWSSQELKGIEDEGYGRMQSFFFLPGKILKNWAPGERCDREAPGECAKLFCGRASLRFESTPGHMKALERFRQLAGEKDWRTELEAAKKQADLFLTRAFAELSAKTGRERSDVRVSDVRRIFSEGLGGAWAFKIAKRQVAAASRSTTIAEHETLTI